MRGTNWAPQLGSQLGSARWHLFGNPAVAAEAWTTFLDGPEEEVRRNAGRRPVPYNRVAWSVPVVTLRARSEEHTSELQSL